MKRMTNLHKNEDAEESISDFSRFYTLTILYEGPTRYSIINRFKKRVKKKKPKLSLPVPAAA